MALVINTRELGRNHPETIRTLDFVGGLLRRQQKSGAAEPVLREVVKLTGEVRGMQDPAYATALHELAQLLRAQVGLAGLSCWRDCVRILFVQQVCRRDFVLR